MQVSTGPQTWTGWSRPGKPGLAWNPPKACREFQCITRDLCFDPLGDKSLQSVIFRDFGNGMLGKGMSSRPSEGFALLVVCPGGI
ncbi:MAG: hypothetical protein JWM16_3732 [Verrucomicrobiales bacterium]|nr:hypothetical protein [Verrucomicrobiales bacterium]